MHQDAAGVVIYHGVKIDFASVKQLDDREINMPKLIGLDCALTHFRFGGIDPFSRSSPTVLADPLAPRRRGREHLAEPLG